MKSRWKKRGNGGLAQKPSRLKGIVSARLEAQARAEAPALLEEVRSENKPRLDVVVYHAELEDDGEY